MSSYLEDAIGFLEGEVSDCVGKVSRSDIDQAGQLQADCGGKLRKLAAAHWLINKSATDFLRCLSAAAECRLEFIKKPGALDHYFYAVNSVDSMENVIIVGERASVEEFANASAASNHSHGHITDWAYQKVLGAAALKGSESISDAGAWEKLTDDPHSIYIHPAKCIKALLACDEVAFQTEFNSWCQTVSVLVPDEFELREADQNESQASALIEALDSSVFFAGLTVIKLAARASIQLDDDQLVDCGLESLSRATR